MSNIKVRNLKIGDKITPRRKDSIFFGNIYKVLSIDSELYYLVKLKVLKSKIGTKGNRYWSIQNGELKNARRVK